VKVNFTRLDGVPAIATITAVKQRSGYYVGYIQIGSIKKRVTHQKVNRIDAISDTCLALMRYADNAII